MSYDFLFRPRRLRMNGTIREMVRETHLRLDDLIYPIFVTAQADAKEPISSMPGCFQWGLNNAGDFCKSVEDAGIPAVILFGLPEEKDALGAAAYDPDGVIPRAIEKIKSKCSKLVVMTDVCLCEYTSHGHCGILDGEKILNDETVTALCKEAVAHAQAGSDVIAPSDMMDGRIEAIRDALDEAGFTYTPIMAYSVKYASGYYGPFRDAVDSSPAFGDRRTHQMDPPNRMEALRQAEIDLNTGADILMVKPALAYLDIIRELRNRYDVPLAAYNVSGEYSMIKAADEKGWLDEERVVLENMIAMKRAGVDMILTYHAMDIAKWLKA